MRLASAHLSWCVLSQAVPRAASTGYISAPSVITSPAPPPAQGAQEQRQPCSSLSSVRSRLLPPRHAAIDPAPARRSCLMHAQCWPAPAPRRTVTRLRRGKRPTVRLPFTCPRVPGCRPSSRITRPGLFLGTRHDALLLRCRSTCTVPPPLFRRIGVRFLASVPCRGPGRGDSCLRVHCHTVHCAGAASTCRSTRSTCNSSSLM
ncbi:hypothetical protein PVAP13_1NG060775 [Panicum virgatum]|uniref:Uncharacterized protein n=1 Tax=Panicum virgatum TaxID=38727 RepID=A0A8T0WZN1_PANVG|nr:hypothetical protein PVAP13_1NG060775 [Panicum virgatum]